MLSLSIKYCGGGNYRTRSPLDLEMSERDFKVGEELSAKVSRKRSVQQNEFFHGIIEAAFANQRGGATCATWRHLKSHLLIAAGHCDEERIALKGLPVGDVSGVVGPIAAALKRKFDVVETSYDKSRHEIVMRFAKSWKFEKTSGVTAGEITDRVVAIICAEIVPGVTPERLFEMAKERATW